MQKKIYDLWPNQMDICLSKIQLQTCVQQVGIQEYSQYPNDSIRMVAPEQDNFSLAAFSVNRETQKGFNYSNNFQL